ncbi:hypothetical protein [Mycolicibacterium sp. lyk4-40-TYG-92]|uniref:hypothetical protein n=1 Tax=Mycolicibacterium sp. lyk4-40-TYG-92 TaxID=3040295 RepID=UPI00254EBBB4|nr:hypothetical protein [Mycolicibacterium sp. lyk4-40-TYG-92]
MGKPGGRHEKKLARQQNNARKEIVTADTAAGKNLPTASGPQANDSDRFQWNGSTVDHEHDGAWSWRLSPSEIQELLATLSDLMQLSWAEVRAQTYNGKGGARRVLHKSQSVGSLCAAARDRLDELQISTEQMFRLRRGTNLRIWGYVQGSVLHLLWYDKDHKVCPIDN